MKCNFNEEGYCTLKITCGDTMRKCDKEKCIFNKE